MTPATDLYFGTLAVKSGFASPSEIELALEAQKDAGDAPHKLGEILAEMGTLTGAQVQTVLDTQTRLRLADPDASTTSIKLEEIPSAALVQESGPPLSVNDEPLAAPRTLKSGDRLKSGELSLRFTGDAIEIRPREAAAPPAEKPAEPAPPKPSILATLLPALRAVDGLFAGIPPAIHTQRKYVIAAAALGAVAFVLPWRIAANGNSVLGIQGPGWIPFLLSLVPLSLTLFSRPGEPFTRVERLAASAAAGAALLILVAKFLFPPAYAAGRGLGLYGSILATMLLLTAGAVPRAGGTGPASDAPTIGTRLWKRLSGFLGSVSGKRAKDLAAAMDQRDALLVKIGEAALEAHATLPEAAAAVQARDALAKAAKEAGEPGAGVKSKAALKAAEAKSKRAFGKLAQKALDASLPLPGQDDAIAGLRGAEARIKELS